jgi:abortive infection bacteriophage resistance protein
MRNFGGFSLMQYTKPALSFEDQLRLLEKRGLVVEDREFANAVLSRISYYRLICAYCKQFQKPNSDDFEPGSTFKDIYLLYVFDKTLRFALADALETIEVYLRTQVTYQLSMADGAFAHLNKDNFSLIYDHAAFAEKVTALEEDSSDKFVEHFRLKYHEENHLPIWMATELMSFGMISRMYAGLKNEFQKPIAAKFNLHPSVLRTWFHTLSYIRNVCAHHGLLWNRELAITPEIPYKNGRWPYLGANPKSAYAVMVILQDLAVTINPSSQCRQVFLKHLTKCDERQLNGLKVPKNWKTFSPWVDIP